MLKLYHFTANWYFESIKREGLTKGVTPTTLKNDKDQMLFIQNTQWLTLDGDVDHQFWTTYNRNQARFTICIPKELAKQKLMSTQTFCEVFKDKLPEGFMDDPIANDWYVYLGTIPKQWLISARKYPKVTK